MDFSGQRIFPVHSIFYGGVDTAAPVAGVIGDVDVAALVADWNDDVHVVNLRKTLCTEITR